METAWSVADTGGATVAGVSAIQSVKVAQIQANAILEICVNATTTLANITTESCVEVGSVRLSLYFTRSVRSVWPGGVMDMG